MCQALGKKDNYIKSSGPFIVPNGVCNPVRQPDRAVRGELFEGREGNVAMEMMKVFQKNSLETF